MLWISKYFCDKNKGLIVIEGQDFIMYELRRYNTNWYVNIDQITMMC